MKTLPPLAVALITLLAPQIDAQTQPPSLGVPSEDKTPARVSEKNDLPVLTPATPIIPQGPASVRPMPVPPLPPTPTPALPTPLPAPSGQLAPGQDFAPLGLRNSLTNQPPPKDPTPLPAPREQIVVQGEQPLDMTVHRSFWPEVWGFGGIVATTGQRMAPNGVAYNPIFDMQAQLNFGLLPDKKLYILSEMNFWGQQAGAAVTSPNQGSFDFSKREWDFNLGIAWNYWGALEFRFWGYANNNLNRGQSTVSPYGFNDGIVFENRWYFNNADKYDVGKLSFLSIGYMPASDSLIGQDGRTFATGLMARAYLTCDIPMFRSYLFFDGQYTSDNSFAPRLLTYDSGVAIRPWLSLQNLEFRVGGMGVYDVQFHYDRSVGYVGVRLNF